MNYSIPPTSSQKVEEALQVYLKKSFASSQVSASLEAFFHDKLYVSKVIEKGLSFGFFQKIQDLLSFTEKDWAEYLNISTKSLQRHRKEKNYFFKPLHSEKILEIVELVHRGESVFGSSEKFHTWLNTPSVALGGKKPFDLLKNSYGRSLLLDELNRIEHGIFA